MILTLKVTLGYLILFASMVIPCIGMAGALFLQDPLYIIPMIFGTFLLIFVAHSPLLNYIDKTQRKIFDV